MAELIYHNFAQAKQALSGIEAIDYFFAKDVLVAVNCEEADSVQLFHLCAALTQSLRQGHVCLPINEVASQQWLAPERGDSVDEQKSFQFESFTELKALLIRLNILPSDNQLIVFDKDCLYLKRYWLFERELQQQLSERLTAKARYSNVDIKACITELFPVDEKLKSTEVDWQEVAVANAINKGFAIIAGGPGTGKTYTVTKLLAAIVSLQQKTQQAALKIALIAPTGKAAQRLSESIINAKAGFTDLVAAKVLSAIPDEAKTIHRLLGVIPNQPNFKYNENNLLSYDVILIDEVSMVDLPLMTRLFRALKPSAQVIMLGDADQLPSVSAGSVLADIAPRPHAGYSVANSQYLAQVCQSYSLSPSLSEAACQRNSMDYLTLLSKSRRFDGAGGIGLLAQAVIAGDVKQSWHLLSEEHNEQLTFEQGELKQWLMPLVDKYYLPLKQCTDLAQAFALLLKFRILCATRKGAQGVEEINNVIDAMMTGKGTQWQQEPHNLYHGKPIMITENDYQLGLYNGDIGIVWQNDDKQLSVYFEQSSQSDNAERYKRVMPSRLPSHESVFAMTIHKTQGSEFSHVAMVLPEGGEQSQSQQQLLSRELLYTGITRAKTHLSIASDKVTWQRSVLAKVKRHSQLAL